EAARRVHQSLTARNRIIFNRYGVPQSETNLEKRKRVNAGDKEFAEVSGELSRLILDPAAGELGAKRLLIVADGALHYIPFGALPDPSGRRPGGKQQPLLLQH